MSDREIFYNSAIQEAMAEEMERDDAVFLMGEDVATYGGVYKCSAGLLERFGRGRVRDSSISEAAIAGAGVGAAIQGMRPIVEIMYADFIPIAMDAIVNQASLLYFVSGGKINIPMVVRTQGGSGSYAGAQHSKNLESWFTHIPGLKVLAPATPYDAKGLLKAAIRDDNPVIFFEHKTLYRTTGIVPEKEYVLEIGKADVKKAGTDVTLIAWSKMVNTSLEAAELMSADGISAEVIDLRSLVPLDEETIFASVKKTNRAVVVQEAWRNTGFAAEISSRIQEGVFDYLDGPVVRVAGRNAPIPFSPELEPSAAPRAEDIVRGVNSLW